MEAALIRIQPRLKPKTIDASNPTFGNRVRSIDSKAFQLFCH